MDGRARLVVLLRRPPAALAALGAFAVAGLASAILAPAHRDLALKFSLRLVAAAVFAAAVAVASPRARRWALAALAVSSLVVAALAIGEGLGLRGLDPWLDLFRDRVFTAGESRRATAGANGPNQAAALLAAGLIAGVAVLGARLRLVVPCAAVLAAGLAFTFSRGGLVAALGGLLVLAGVRREHRRVSLAAAATLCALAAGFLLHQGFRQRVRTELTARDYAAEYRPQDRSVRLQPGERRMLAIELVNTGRRDWTPSELATMNAFLYEWPSRRPAGVWRLPLPRVVAAGATESVALEVQAPAQAGTYVLAWDLFTLPSAYLSNSRLPPALVPLGVGVEPPANVSLPGEVWRRGRGELWRLALVMWRDRPLLGVGPDNFRRLHPQYGGWLVPGFHPMTAHSLFLETAADTGALGLLALLGTLAFAWRSAWSRRDALVGSACLALLAAIVLQGTVDALLEYTGCYLLFAFAVGSAVAEEPDPTGARILP